MEPSIHEDLTDVRSGYSAVIEFMSSQQISKMQEAVDAQEPFVSLHYSLLSYM